MRWCLCFVSLLVGCGAAQESSQVASTHHTPPPPSGDLLQADTAAREEDAVGGLGIRGEDIAQRRNEQSPTAAPGSLSREIIQRVIRENALDAVRSCYETALATEPTLQGRVTASFIIGADGRVIRAAISSDGVGNQAIADCILATVRSLVFPSPEGGVVGVNYPFVLTSEE